ncbi:MAG: agmatinase family protein [Bacteroidota bacterium]
MSFNPNEIAPSNNNIFGFPFTEDEARIILIPVPWDATASYRAGTSMGPEAILAASPQLDFFDFDIPEVWNIGINMLPVSEKWIEINDGTRGESECYLDMLSKGLSASNNVEMTEIINEVNKQSIELNKYVEETCKHYLSKNKLVGVIGGEHSVPLGFMKALSEIHTSFGILHIDAHADLRNSYEDFEFSHASIMFNALKLKSVSNLTQVGIRDFCQDEYQLINKDKRINTFFDYNLKEQKYKGKSWDAICDEIIVSLPEKVYISFDIDGLTPNYCPNTGTPVPGGLDYSEAEYIIRKLAKSGKQIIGFDLSEVTPGADEWDANVGARLIFLLSNMMYLSLERRKNSEF